MTEMVACSVRSELVCGELMLSALVCTAVSSCAVSWALEAKLSQADNVQASRVCSALGELCVCECAVEAVCAELGVQ